MLLFLLATACTSDEAKSNDSSGNTPHDNYASAMPLEFGACGALAAAADLSTPEQVWEAVSGYQVDFEQVELLYEVPLSFRDDTCPSLVSTSTSEYIEGGCETNRGDVYRGRFWSEQSAADAASDVFRWTWQQFEFTSASGDISLKVDGTLMSNRSDGPSITEATLFSYQVVHNGTYALNQGTWGHHSVMFEEQPFGELSSQYGYVYVSGASSALTGDLCETWNINGASDVCPDEGNGVIFLDGAQSAVVYLDGDSDCDGCVEVEIGDSPPVSYCPPSLPR